MEPLHLVGAKLAQDVQLFGAFDAFRSHRNAESIGQTGNAGYDRLATDILDHVGHERAIYLDPVEREAAKIA